jgi:hypothetical protein
VSRWLHMSIQILDRSGFLPVLVQSLVLGAN